MKNLQILLIFVGVALVSNDSYAAARWIPVKATDVSCYVSCGRVGLESIASKAAGRQNVAVGVVVSDDDSQIINGNSKVGGLKKGQKAYCLCAEDGQDKGTDFAWASHSYPARCDKTCDKMAPQYGYAVYVDHNKNSWNQICANKSGQLGASQRKVGDCNIDNKRLKNFGCLCTRSFVPDLEAGVDP